MANAIVDGMTYARGAADDYDRWAEVTGDSGWSWNNLLPYFLKVNTHCTYLPVSYIANFESTRRRSGVPPQTATTRRANTTQPSTQRKAWLG